MNYNLILMLSLLLTVSYTAQAQDRERGCVEGNCENGWGIYEYYVGKTYQGHYEGNFKEGKRHGKGQFTYANGDKYDGEWAEGRPNGLGARVTKNGKVKYGKWESGKLVERIKNKVELDCMVGNCKEGYGKAKDEIGNVYNGAFAKGSYNGFGEMKYANGDRYKGYFINGVPHGKGSYYFKNGHVDTGEFFEGKYTHNKMKIWAVIVGVADYENFSDLNFTRNDAQNVYAFFRSVEGGAVPAEQMALLLDKEATAFNITNTAAELFEQADTNDLIIFYFAGHGKNGAFLPVDYDGKKGNMLHHGIVNSLLKDSPAKYKLCVADACHSGSFDMNSVMAYQDYLQAYKETGETDLVAATRSTKNVRERIKNYYKSFDNVKGGLAVVMSSASEEISLEANKLEQGVFSYYFIQALKGAANQADEKGKKDAVIDINELYKFIDKNVRNFTYGFQHPHIYGEYDNQMPVSLLKVK